MSNTKISNETLLTGTNLNPANDVLPIVDVSQGTTGNRKITPSEFHNGSPASSTQAGSMSATDKAKLDSITVANLVTTNTNQTITATKTISVQSVAVSSSAPSAPSSGNILLYSKDSSGDTISFYSNSRW